MEVTVTTVYNVEMSQDDLEDFCGATEMSIEDAIWDGMTDIVRDNENIYDWGTCVDEIDVDVEVTNIIELEFEEDEEDDEKV